MQVSRPGDTFGVAPEVCRVDQSRRPRGTDAAWSAPTGFARRQQPQVDRFDQEAHLPPFVL